MNKLDLEQHLRALTFRYDRLAKNHADLKLKHENTYKDYKHLFWRLYWRKI